MAQVIISGGAVVIKSAAKVSELESLAKYRPENLVLRDEKNEPVFKIGLTDGQGKINVYGAEFARISRDGFATITVTAPQEWGVDDVVDVIGPALLKLNQLEKDFNVALEDIENEKADIMSNITIV